MEPPSAQAPSASCLPRTCVAFGRGCAQVPAGGGARASAPPKLVLAQHDTYTNILSPFISDARSYSLRIAFACGKALAR